MAMGVAAGALTERLTIQQKTTTADGQGGRAVTAWPTFATVWGRVEPLRMHERIQAAAIGATLAYRVTVRYRGDLTPAMRIEWTPYGYSTAKTLQIHGVQPLDGGRAGLVLECSEVI